MWITRRALSVLVCVLLPHAGVQARDDEVIADPELGGSPSVAPAAPAVEPTGFAAEARLVLHSRFGADIQHGDPHEEVWESTSIAALEATLRRSDTLRIGLGVRARYHAAWLAAPVADAVAGRFEFDAAITAGYVDIRLGDNVHLQLGYQPVQLGRFDFISGIDVLSSFDLREGPATMPDAYQLAQLAVRVDYNPVDWLALRVLYVPLFTPHLISLVESDYGVAHPRQGSIDNLSSMLGIAELLATYLSRADRERLAQSSLSVIAPEPNLSAQQAAFRASINGLAGELAFTAATALEHLPAVYVARDAIELLGDPERVAALFANVAQPVRVEYGRFGLLALDGSLDLAPFSLGFEAALQWHRTLYTLGTGSYPETLPLPDTADIVHVGAKLDYVNQDEWLITLETFADYTLNTPRDPSRGWMFLAAGRYLAGAALVTIWQPFSALHVALGALVLNGPSLILAPRIGYEFLAGWEIELGAIAVEGPVPPLYATPRIALGSVWSTTDQVFIGVRYVM